MSLNLPAVSDSLVIIPTYNEKENIPRMLDTVMALTPKRGDAFHVLVVDDGSPDGTADLVREAQARHEGRIHLLERSGKLGLGTAYIAGFKWGLEQGYAYLFEMDADFSHNPNDLERLREACLDGAGVAVGSRYTKGGGVSNWPWHRIAMSYGASLYASTRSSASASRTPPPDSSAIGQRRCAPSGSTTSTSSGTPSRSR